VPGLARLLVWARKRDQPPPLEKRAVAVKEVAATARYCVSKVCWNSPTRCIIAVILAAVLIELLDVIIVYE
jgi:hypothetical protein